MASVLKNWPEQAQLYADFMIYWLMALAGVLGSEFKFIIAVFLIAYGCIFFISLRGVEKSVNPSDKSPDNIFCRFLYNRYKI
jgi:hypothetical protein